MEAMITDYTRLHVQRQRLDAFFGSMTTWIAAVIEYHTLQAWLCTIYWQAIMLLRYRVNTMKTRAKTWHRFPFLLETFPYKRSLNDSPKTLQNDAYRPTSNPQGATKGETGYGSSSRQTLTFDPSEGFPEPRPKQQWERRWRHSRQEGTQTEQDSLTNKAARDHNCVIQIHTYI